MQASTDYPNDPRMRGFESRARVEDVLSAFEERARPISAELISIWNGLGRILASDVVSTRTIPDFDRAAMDGYALKGEETFGCDSYNPAQFRIVARARPGQKLEIAVRSGEAVEIATGAPIPAGADTVVRVESTTVERETVFVREPTPIGRHVGLRGEDVSSGTCVLETGRQLRPQDLGLLSSIGVAEVSVLRKPRVTIILTGNEILPAGAEASGCRITDANSPMLFALVLRDGGIPDVVGPFPDDRGLLRSTLLEAASSSDLVMVSGGSSTGPEDHAPSLVAELGKLSIHGLAIRPASPSGIGFIHSVPILLLPGNPVSCLCAYDLFGSEIVRSSAGIHGNRPYPEITLPLSRKISSPIGRLDYVRMIVLMINDELFAEPLATSGASILSSTTRADGFALVPEDLEGYAKGEFVKIWLYDRTLEVGPL